MALHARNADKRRILQDFRRHEEEVIGSLCRLSNRPVSPKTQMEQERRIRREIANSNERRRMQSINAGFQSLRTLLPHHAGEKLSKAAILQQTTQYIYQIEQEKTRLLTQNCQLKRLLNQQNQDSDGGSSSPDSPLPKRKKNDTDSLAMEDVVVNVGDDSPSHPGETNVERIKQEVAELKMQLQQERRLRIILEEQNRTLESQLYPDRMLDMPLQVHLQYQVPHSEHPGNRADRSRSSSPATDRLKPSSPYSPASMSANVTSSTHATSSMPAVSTTSSIHSCQESRVPPISHSKSSDDVKIKKELVVSEGNDDNGDDEDDDDEEEDEDEEDSGDSRRLTRQRTTQRPSSPCGPAPDVAHLIPRPSRAVCVASTSRQNLETIVEAIRHLEGDHLFNDDPIPRRTVGHVKSSVNSTSSSSNNNNNVTITTATTTIYSPRSPSPLSSDAPVAAAAMVTTADLSYRHHVIRASQPQTRPGVIVSAYS